MLQVVATKGLAVAKSTASSSAVTRGCTGKVANSRIASVRSVSATSHSLRQKQARIAISKYSTGAPKAEADQEQVWEDIDKVQDFYDPRWDKDVPEEEGTLVFSLHPSHAI